MMAAVRSTCHFEDYAGRYMRARLTYEVSGNQQNTKQLGNSSALLGLELGSRKYSSLAC